MKGIASNKAIGISHHHLWEEVVRTPLGGFINHSEKPNCYLDRVVSVSWLCALRPIKKDEELTLKYEMYEVDEISQ